MPIRSSSAPAPSAPAPLPANAAVADIAAQPRRARSQTRRRTADAFGPAPRQPSPAATDNVRRPGGQPLLIDQIERASSIDRTMAQAIVDRAMLAPAHTVEILRALAAQAGKVPLVDREAAFAAFDRAFRRLPQPDRDALGDALARMARAMHDVPRCYAEAEFAVLNEDSTADAAAARYGITDGAQLARLRAAASTASTVATRAGCELRIAEAGAVQLLAVAVPLVRNLFADVAVHATDDSVAAVARAHAEATVARGNTDGPHPPTALEAWQAALAAVQRAAAEAPEAAPQALATLRTASGLLFAPALYVPLPPTMRETAEPAAN